MQSRFGAPPPKLRWPGPMIRLSPSECRRSSGRAPVDRQSKAIAVQWPLSVQGGSVGGSVKMLVAPQDRRWRGSQSDYALIVIRDTRAPSTGKLKWLGPLNPSPPTSAVTTVASPSRSMLRMSRLTCLPMNSWSLHPLIASDPTNSLPQSSTTPPSANVARNVSVVGVCCLKQSGHGAGADPDLEAMST